MSSDDGITSECESEETTDSEFDDKNAASYFSLLSSYIMSAGTRKVSYANGLDAWVPSDAHAIAELPSNLWDRYRKIYPKTEASLRNGTFAVVTADTNRSPSPSSESQPPEEELKSTSERDEKQSNGNSVEAKETPSNGNASDVEDRKSNGSSNEKPEETNDRDPLNHLVFKFWKGSHENTRVLSLYRSRKVTDVVALCERCRECSVLFKYSLEGVSKADYISTLLSTLESHKMWKPVHIAAFMGIKEYFTKGGRSVKAVMHCLSQPEGISPLIIAVQNNNISLVEFLLQFYKTDLLMDACSHCNILHYAAVTSPEMIKILMDSDRCDKLLNAPNADGYTPLSLAVYCVSPYCAKMLRSYGASMSATSSTTEFSPLLEAMKKRMDVTSLKAVFEAFPDCLNDKEELTGNSAIHVASQKRTLLSLLELKSDELHLDVRNRLMQTPLHLFVQRNNLPLVMALLAYPVDINAKDSNGNSPLHLAVTNLNVDIVKAFLCLGAQVNIVNNHGETPRHLVARFKNEEAGKEILYALVLCGATPCAKGFIGCSSACVHKDNFIGERKKNSDSSTPDEVNIQRQNVDVNAPTGAYEYELDPDSHFLDKAYKEPNPVRDFPQQAAIKQVMEYMKNVTPESSKLINVLSLDGGGIKGLVIAQILIGLEKYLDAPIFSYFDWVAGTSTGSFVAASLLSGKSLSDCQRFYLRFKDGLFDTWSRPYNSMVLEGFIKQMCGENGKLSDFKYPKFFFTTVRADTFPCQLELDRNYRLPLTDEENEVLGFNDPNEMYLWKSARRSSAAPTYFSASEGKFIDGGMVANNPTLDLLSEIHFWNSVCQYKNVDRDVKVGCVVSIGTGITPVSPVDPSVFEMGDMFGLLRGIKNLSLMVLDQATATEGAPISRSRSWCHSTGSPYYRLNAPLFKDIMLDTKEDIDLVKMMWDTVVYCHTHKHDFEELASVLKTIGVNKHRRRRAATPL